jgi:hypothetical protein
MLITQEWHYLSILDVITVLAQDLVSRAQPWSR